MTERNPDSVVAELVDPELRPRIEQLLDLERARSGRLLAKIRFFGAAWTLLACVVAAYVFDSPGWRATVPPLSCYVALAGILFVASLRIPAVAQRSGYLVGGFDIPVVTIASYILPVLTAAPGAAVEAIHGDKFLLLPLIPIQIAFIIIAGLSLTPNAILVAAISACVFGAIPCVMEQGSVADVAAAFVAPLCAGAACIHVVKRMRSFVLRTHERDFVGRYFLHRKLGAGGMGEVWLASYRAEGGFERSVALKQIYSDGTTEPNAAELFMREARLGARINHPSVVQVLDFGRAKGSLFLAMEYVEGKPLSRIIHELRAAGRLLPIPAAVSIALSVARALEHIQALPGSDNEVLRLVHRDVNPPNLLVSTSGAVKLADFGIARTLGRECQTTTGVLRGKLAYMSPEQIAGGEVDGRTDLFALGLTLLEVMNGQRVFAAATDVALLGAVLDAPIAPLRQTRPDASPELARVVEQLVSRDPETRTASATELIRQLESLPEYAAAISGGPQLLAELAQAGPTRTVTVSGDRVSVDSPTPRMASAAQGLVTATTIAERVKQLDDSSARLPHK